MGFRMAATISVGLIILPLLIDLKGEEQCAHGEFDTVKLGVVAIDHIDVLPEIIGQHHFLKEPPQDLTQTVLGLIHIKPTPSFELR